jgi:hypothetical protein
MLAGGLNVEDTLYLGNRAPLYTEFREGVKTHYRATYGEDSPSLMMYAKRPFGWNARWRGPAPELTFAYGIQFSRNRPVLASYRYTDMRPWARSHDSA